MRNQIWQSNISYINDNTANNLNGCENIISDVSIRDENFAENYLHPSTFIKIKKKCKSTD